RAAALRAEEIGAVAREKHAHVHAVALPLQALEPAADAFVLPVAFDDELFLLVAELAVRLFRGNALALAEIHQPGHAPLLAAPRRDRAVGERPRRVGNDEVEIDVDDAAEAAAGFARAERAVKRKQVGRRIAVAQIAMSAVKVAAEGLDAPALVGIIEPDA